MLQRELNLGYNRCGKIIDQLEEAQIIGGFRGGEPREVLINSETYLETFLTIYKK